MATTPNYGWVMPDPTDFVTDLPADFEIFGDAADASVKALNPGTTAGDLDYYTSSTAKARLGIGTAGQMLAVNSGATAPEWIAAPAGAMTVLATGTLSGAAVNITSIPTTYNDLVLIVRSFEVTTGSASLQMRVNNLSSSNYANDPTGGANFTLNQFSITGSGDPDANLAFARVTIFDYADTAHFKNLQRNGFLTETSGVQIYGTRGETVVNTQSAITEINLIPSASTFSAGSFILYGVK